MTLSEIYLPEVVGRGYADYWNFKGRYRVVKGSRASKKSTTTAMNLIYNIMKYPKTNGLVVRKVYRTIKDSCFAQLKWAINRLKVERYWKATTNPLELTYIPTGQKILFRGLDDPLKVASVSVEEGYLNFLWIEEAYEIMNESDFNMLDESIRGKTPSDIYKQITLTLNPWNERHWIKERFFDVEDDEVLAITTNYLCNEWLDQSDKRMFERMRLHNPKRYKVAGLGEWGIVDGLVYENWGVKPFEIKDLPTYFGLDFGYTNDPTAFFCAQLDKENATIYVFDELYQKGMSNQDIYNKLTEMGFKNDLITADSAEPKSIDELKRLGLSRIKGAKKGKDSVNNGIQKLQNYKIVIHPKCNNFITEISNYQWDEDRFGKKINKPIDDMNHLMDAMRYAFETLQDEYKIRTMSKRKLRI